MPTSITVKDYIDGRIDDLSTRMDDRFSALEREWAKDVERAKADAVLVATEKAASIIAAATSRNRFVTLLVTVISASVGGLVAVIKGGWTK
jgi:hypothetical protein